MTTVYVLHALLVAFRTARFDGKAVGQYDRSFEGFFRSFFAAVLCIPLYLFVTLGETQVMMDFDSMGADGEAAVARSSGFAGYFMDIVTYAIGWVAFPLAMIGIAKLIGAGSRYVPYIVAYNWGTIIVLLATVPPYLLYVMGFATPTGFMILYYVSVAFVLSYRWRLAKEGLQVSTATAVGIVAFDVLLSAIIVLLAVRVQRLL